MDAACLLLRNGQAAELEFVPQVAFSQFSQAISQAIEKGGRILAYFACPLKKLDRYQLFAIVADPLSGYLRLLSTNIAHSYPSLTPKCPQLHWFERELAEQWQILPEGHPWLKPLRFHAPYPVFDQSPIPGIMDYFQVTGQDVHEVAVGPVHAGIIEPGHFRFQCHGEKVLHLEITLGYQHRGIEQALWGGPGKRSIHLIETLAGDTSVGHTIAYCQLLEALSSQEISLRTQWIRVLALELERLANHTGDLGALAGDVGFLPTAAYCGRLRGDFLNMTALLCGNRFGRGLIRPGGIGFELEPSRTLELQQRLHQIKKNLHDAISLLWETPSVTTRFAETGRLGADICRQLGIVGLAARAAGLKQDVRYEFPTGLFKTIQIPVSTWHSGDVFGRAYVRWLELQRSFKLVLDLLAINPPKTNEPERKSLGTNQIAVSVVEGWRGEICHVAITNEQGYFSTYKAIDPSCHNWMGLALAMRNQQISDFPLCNKSFNLSYCGHDL